MRELWTPEEEAQRLAERFDSDPTINQKQFAETFKVPGGASNLSQHKKGHRPLNLDAAIAYAVGFGVTLEEISPRLAQQVRDALPLLADSSTVTAWRQLADEEIEKETDPDVVLLLKTFFRDIDERLKARQTIASAAANMRSKVNTSQPAAESVHQK